MERHNLNVWSAGVRAGRFDCQKGLRAGDILNLVAAAAAEADQRGALAGGSVALDLVEVRAEEHRRRRRAHDRRRGRGRRRHRRVADRGRRPRLAAQQTLAH